MNSDSVSSAGELNAWPRAGLTNAGSAAGTGPAPDATVLAADADRERTVDRLKAAFTEGRLTKDEFDTRVARALSARLHGELIAAMSGLPTGTPSPGAAPGHGSPGACPAPDLTVKGRPFGRPLLLWALAELAWAAATEALHHRWPASLAVSMVLLAGFLAVTAGVMRCAWRVMAGR
jgi:hypothetical protein